MLKYSVHIFVKMYQIQRLEVSGAVHDIYMALVG
jgi:hypothetical protein